MLLTRTQVAARLGLSEKTADQVLQKLPYVMAGRRKRYASESVEAFERSGSLPDVQKGSEQPTETVA